MMPGQGLPDKPEISLHEFFLQAWSYIDPAALIDGWPIQAVCEHLEAMSLGQIRNLVVCQPPRTGKSTVASIMWPAWEWTWKPKTRFMYVSYAAELSNDHSIKTRRLLETSWYQSFWGERFQILPDRYKITMFENDRGGSRQATSVTGTATGFGADIIVFDDAADPRRSESEIIRVATNTWYKETMTTRRNDLKTGRRLIIQQRLHQEDLVGFAQVEEPNTFDVLELPMEYEPFRDRTGVLLPKPVTTIGWSDPRNDEGELLWPERVGPAEIEILKNLGEYGYAAQCQQRPSPRGGGLLKRKWFEDHVAGPAKWAPKVRYWDKAASIDPKSARTAGALVSRDPTTGRYCSEEIVKGRWATQEREQVIKDTAEADGPETLIWIEQEPGSAGKDSVVDTVRNLPGYVVCIDRVTGNKVSRAKALITNASIGNVDMNPGEWNEDWLTESSVFPYGRFKDQVDAVAGAISKLAEGEPWNDASAGARPKAQIR